MIGFIDESCTSKMCHLQDVLAAESECDEKWLVVPVRPELKSPQPRRVDRGGRALGLLREYLRARMERGPKHLAARRRVARAQPARRRRRLRTADDASFFLREAVALLVALGLPLGSTRRESHRPFAAHVPRPPLAEGWAVWLFESSVRLEVSFSASPRHGAQPMGASRGGVEGAAGIVLDGASRSLVS